MSRELVTIRKNASVQQALALMKEKSVRHLPVVEPDGTLTGWITDADLRGVLIASMLEELTLEDVMVRRPFVATPDMPLEDAAKLILQKKIGGVPVIEGDKLIGVITVVDILSAFISIMGLLDHSSRLDVTVSSVQSPLDEIAALIRKHNAEVISICHLPSEGLEESTFSIRLKKCDLSPIVADLEKNGVKVVSSID
jgi:acetoin utilization protein AcuB